MSKNITLKITGMHCDSCAKIITMELSDLPGVKDIKIDAKAGAGSLTLDNSLNTKDEVIAAIKRAGYDAVAAE